MLSAARWTAVGALVLILAIVGRNTSAADAEISLVRPTRPDAILLGRELEILEDPSGVATLADIMGSLHGSFERSDIDKPTFGLSRGAAWTRVQVGLSQDPRRETRRVQFSALHPDTASFFVVDEAGNVLRSYHGGLDHPGSNTIPRFFVAVGDFSTERFTLYARLTSHYISTLQQSLITAEEETSREVAVMRMVGPCLAQPPSRFSFDCYCEPICARRFMVTVSPSSPRSLSRHSPT